MTFRNLIIIIFTKNNSVITKHSSKELGAATSPKKLQKPQNEKCII